MNNNPNTLRLHPAFHPHFKDFDEAAYDPRQPDQFYEAALFIHEDIKLYRGKVKNTKKNREMLNRSLLHLLGGYFPPGTLFVWQRWLQYRKLNFITDPDQFRAFVWGE